MALERIKDLRPVKRYRSERYVLIPPVRFALAVDAWLRGGLALFAAAIRAAAVESATLAPGTS